MRHIFERLVREASDAVKVWHVVTDERGQDALLFLQVGNKGFHNNV